MTEQNATLNMNTRTENVSIQSTYETPIVVSQGIVQSTNETPSVVSTGIVQSPPTPYETTVNFMGGRSFKLNPLQTLRIVSTSMICGENMYYRTNHNEQSIFNERGKCSSARLSDYVLFPDLYKIDEDNSEDYFTQIIQKALKYDYGGTLEFVKQLRQDYYMRLNSHALVVSAIHHPSRVPFNAEHPNKMKEAIRSACLIPTDWTTQFQLLKASKRPIPNIWKKSIAGLLENMTAYHASKYIHGSKSGNSTGPPAILHQLVNNGCRFRVQYMKPQQVKGRKGKMYYPKRPTPPPVVPPILQPDEPYKMSLANLVDLVRITHPKSTPVIDELVKNGKVKVSDDAQTWEKLRSANKTWFEITEQIRMPHMALLRNLRNIAVEFEKVLEDEPVLQDLHEKYVTRANELAKVLVSGVKNGKQFPFRYYSAYKMLKSSCTGKITGRFVDALEDCLLESLDTIPAMNGRVDCLSDNSGSSRHGITSEYGTTNIYEIANLSAILTAYRSTKGGSVWIFGDRLEEYPVSHNKPIMKQLDEINDIGNGIGQSTETGVWLFWDMAIRTNKKLDTVFIYSDMQAGHGGLYASGNHHAQLNKLGAKLSYSGHIDVLCLVKAYRETVYSKVNVFSVQVAGYDNSIMPDILYRGAILSGWTGKEAKLAYEMSRVWDEVENVVFTE
jgi:hypothetical protein